MKKLKNSELNRISVDEFKRARKTPFVLVLDNVRSLNNVGSAFRTSDAFRVDAIYLCGITGRPPSNEIHKTALGAEDSVIWKYFPTTLEAIQELKKNNYLIVSVEQAEGSISLEKFKVEAEAKYALVFGNEVKGVDQRVVDESDLCLEIPQYGTKHSFNISVSIGIVLWDLFRKYHFPE